jgi:hypothetical protein
LSYRVYTLNTRFWTPYVSNSQNRALLYFLIQDLRFRLVRQVLSCVPALSFIGKWTHTDPLIFLMWDLVPRRIPCWSVKPSIWSHFLHFIDLIFCSVVDGAWTTWGPYGSCSVTCGGGTQVRSRSCTNPAPSILGEDCAGPSNSSRECNTQNCPSKKLSSQCIFSDFHLICYLKA